MFLRGVFNTFNVQQKNSASIVVAGLRLLRMMRFVRYFSVSDRLRVIADTFMEVIPWGASQFGIVLLWFYSYGILGMYLLGGKLIRPLATDLKNPLLKTDYHALDFYEVSNFNTILNCFITEFHLTVVNNWHITMRGAIAVTSRWIVVYFITFWLLTIIILMNLVVATVLDIFSSQIHQKLAAEQQKLREEREQQERERLLRTESVGTELSDLL